MIIVYRFLVTIEDHEDVERYIEIKATQTFYELHLAIQEAIGFDGIKDVSFYMSGDFWRKGQELALKKREGALNMKKAILNRFMMDPYQRILYVYDFDNPWDMKVQLTKITKVDEVGTYPRCTKRVGESPRQYPVAPVSEGSDEFNDMVEGVLDVEPVIDLDTDSLLADFNSILKDEAKKDDSESADLEADNSADGEEASE
jgi:hypothetical protein